jgi:hypothetical protein
MEIVRLSRPYTAIRNALHKCIEEAEGHRENGRPVRQKRHGLHWSYHAHDLSHRRAVLHASCRHDPHDHVHLQSHGSPRNVESGLPSMTARCSTALYRIMKLGKLARVVEMVAAECSVQSDQVCHKRPHIIQASDGIHAHHCCLIHCWTSLISGFMN